MRCLIRNPLPDNHSAYLRTERSGLVWPYRSVPATRVIPTPLSYG
jgi:hypothetical protein